MVHCSWCLKNRYIVSNPIPMASKNTVALVDKCCKAVSIVGTNEANYIPTRLLLPIPLIEELNVNTCKDLIFLLSLIHI